MKRPSLTVKQQTALRWAVPVVIALAALAYCLYYAYTVNPYNPDVYTPDERHYIDMARRLLDTGVYSFWGYGPDAYVSPGYPLFLTGCMAIFGTGLEGIFSIKIVNAVLAALTVFLTYVLALQTTKRHAVGIIAAILVAANGSYAFYSRYMLTETLYFFTLVLFFVSFFWAIRRDCVWLHLVPGVLLCVSVMVRPLLIVVAPFLYIPHIVRNWRQWKKMLLPIVLFIAGFVVLALPWWIRNIVSLGKFIPLASQTNPIYAGLAENVAALGLKDPGSLWGNIKLLFHLLFTRPAATLYWMTFGKFSIMFAQPAIVTYYEAFTTLVRNVTLYLGLVGCLRALFQKKHCWTAIVFLIYFASSFAFIPVGRYALQYYPFLAIFAGYLLVNVFGREKTHPRLA